MTKVIAGLGQKGGGGKTTTIVNVASRLHALGNSVVIIDADPQASTADWADTADVVDGETFAVHSVVGSRLQKMIDGILALNETDYLLIDTAAKSEAEALIAARASDLVVIPTRPSILDIRAFRNSVSIAELSGKLDRTHVVFNACGHIGEVAETVEGIRVLYPSLQIAPVALNHYVTFRRAMTAGSDVVSYDKRSKAAEQIIALTEWMSDQVGTVQKGAAA